MKYWSIVESLPNGLERENASLFFAKDKEQQGIYDLEWKFLAGLKP